MRYYHLLHYSMISVNRSLQSSKLHITRTVTLVAYHLFVLDVQSMIVVCFYIGLQFEYDLIHRRFLLA
jgi:hypothetical protein